MSASRVVVKAGYRLHLGFYRYLNEGVAYGSIGVALEEPQLELRLSTSGEPGRLELRAPTEESRKAVAEVVRHLGLNSGTVELSGYVRHHAGLGSITRIYLATAVAAATALRKPDVDVEGLLLKLGRCRYSCVGYYTFIYGGLAVDTGIPLAAERAFPKPLALSRVPRSWLIVLAVPEGRGLSESEEAKHMDNPAAVDEQRDLYRALVELLAAVKLERLDMFTQAVEIIQGVAGRYFSRAQGGFFSSPYGDIVSRAMRESGLRGIGQSSWGPAIYGFTDSYLAAEQARRSILGSLERIGVLCDVWITRVSDLGYTIHFSSSKF